MKVLTKAYYIIYLAGYYLVKLIAANIYIAWDIITPTLHTNPGVIEIETASKKDLSLLLLSNLISMTPGTLSLDINDSKKKMNIHVLYMDRKEATLKEIEKMKEIIFKITG